MIGHVEGDTYAQLMEARKVYELLGEFYPGHPWSVRVMPGLLFIRHLDFPKNYGMALKMREADHDAAVLKRKIIMLAGEWLERANMKRGRADADQEHGRVEGVPERDQPYQPLPDSVKVVVQPEEPRTEPHGPS